MLVIGGCAVLLASNSLLGFGQTRFWFVRRDVAVNWSVFEFVHLNCASLEKFAGRRDYDAFGR